jgi:hypothetical protein
MKSKPKITRNKSGAIRVNGRPIDMYLFSRVLGRHKYGPPSMATAQTIAEFIQKESKPFLG